MGWNRPSADADKAKAKKQGEQRRTRVLVRGGIAALVVVLGAALAWHFLSTSRTSQTSRTTRTSPSRIREAVPAAAPTNAVVKAEDDDMNQPAYKLPDTTGILRPKKWIPTKADVAKSRLGRDGKPRKKSIYKTRTEQMMGQLFSVRLGGRPPTMSMFPEKLSTDEIQRFLDTNFTCEDDASDSVKQNREIMNQVRDELKRYISEGGDVNGFVDYYRNELQTAHDMWKDAQMIMVEMVKSGESEENIMIYNQIANKVLTEKNIRPLLLPPELREKAASGNVVEVISK